MVLPSRSKGDTHPRKFIPRSNEDRKMAIDVKSWANKFKNLTDNDKTIQSMGKYYTCTFMYDMGDQKVIIEMHDGKVKSINTGPAPLDAYDFALRASPETWREFAKPIPNPMYHGIWAASFRKDLKREGNLLALMQNLRNFTVQFELLRKCGVPV